MKFVAVNKVPTHVRKKSLRVFFEEFMAADIKIAKVEMSACDYKSAKVAHSCLSIAAKRHGFPVKVIKRDDEVYLARTDM